MEVQGQDRELRATISDDGRLTNLQGETLGFINEDGSAGDANESFLGEINDDGQISDADNRLIGSVDLGSAEMRDENGSTWCTIQPGGDIVDGIDGFRGHVDPFTFHKLKILAAYLFFFDQNLVDPGRPSKVVPEQPTGEPTLNTTPSQQPEPEPEPEQISPEPAPVPAPTPTPLRPPVQTHPNQIEDRKYKEYRVGEFKSLPGGKENLLEIYDCDCPPSQLSVRIENDGKQVVFQRTIQTHNNRKQQVQRFTVPYQLELNRVKPSYSQSKEGGTLSILLIKPELGGIQSQQSGEFVKFYIPAVLGSEGKVTMKPTQTKEYFLFSSVGEPKLDTEVIGELVDGDQIKFHSIVTDLVAKTKKKVTQTFTLPSKVALDYIEVLASGKEVKVHQKKVTDTKSKQIENIEVPIQ